MKSTPVATFGTVAFVCEAPAGESQTVALGAAGLYDTGYYYVTSGRMELTLAATGERLQDRTAGWYNMDHQNAGASEAGDLLVVYAEDTAWVCIPKNFNGQGLPPLTSLTLSDGEHSVIPRNSNLFLARGTIEINAVRYTGPTQLRVRTADMDACSIGPSFSLFFPPQA